jgi:hypothetical protein
MQCRVACMLRLQLAGDVCLPAAMCYECRKLSLGPVMTLLWLLPLLLLCGVACHNAAARSVTTLTTARTCQQHGVWMRISTRQMETMMTSQACGNTSELSIICAVVLLCYAVTLVSAYLQYKYWLKHAGWGFLALHSSMAYSDAASSRSPFVSGF